MIDAYTPKARPTVSDGEARERIARIIDPEAWTDPAKSDAAYDRTPYRERSLAKADAILAALPTTDGAGEGWAAARVAEVLDEHDGFWRPCTGCQESSEGVVSERDYPYSEIFRCQPGGGCSECGGIGVLWDTTDYDAMARYMLADDTTPPTTDGQRDLTYYREHHCICTASERYVESCPKHERQPTKGDKR